VEEKIVKKVLAPHDCYIILTAKCNQRCLHCYGNYGIDIPEDELTGREWDKVFEDLVNNEVFYINISGGEPTAHPDFVEILSSLKKRKLHFIMTTNGIFNEEKLKAFIDARDYLIGLKISLDGSDYRSNGYIRRDVNKEVNKKQYDLVLKNISLLKEKNIPITISTCIHKGNIGKIEELLELILKIEPVSWFISTISTSGRSLDNLDVFASESEISKSKWQKIREICNNKDIFVNFIDMPTVNSEHEESSFYFQCPAARSFCEINSDGLVTPCPLARVNIPEEIIKFENIKEKSIKEIWTGEAFNKFLKLSTQGCDGCKAKEKCDRCIPQSILWFGDPSNPPPYCIQNGDRLGLKNINILKGELKNQMKKYKRTNYIDISTDEEI
jgi:MoaA/NifB/PqqE/SkfB family radical SAM enzyme